MQWTDDDQDLAIAYEHILHAACPQCHTVPSDWVDEETGFPLEEPVWEPWAQRCYGCADIERYRKSMTGSTDGVFITLLPFDPDRFDAHEIPEGYEVHEPS